MEPSSSLELCERTLARMLQWIAAADAKVGPVLAIDTAMLGVIAALAPTSASWTVKTAICAALAVTGLITSLVMLFFGAFPRTHGPKGSLVYFGGITSRDEQTFIEEMTAPLSVRYLEDLARQCYRNAEIAGDKYKFIKYSMVALFISIVPWILSVFLLYDNAH